MKVQFAIIALLAITWLPNVIPQRYTGYVPLTRNNNATRITRQTSADQMVQNILQWLQGSHSDGNRKIRQDSLRAYLPPSNTQKPRPFQPSGFEVDTIELAPLPVQHETLPPEIYPPSNAPYPQPEEPRYPDTVPPIPEVKPGPNEITGPPGEVPYVTYPHTTDSSETARPPERHPSYPQEPLPNETPAGGYPSSPEGPRVTTGSPETYSSQPQEPGYTNPDFPPSGYPNTKYPQHGIPSNLPQPLPTISDEQTSPESTGYPPAGKTPQPPFTYPEISETPIPPIGFPSITEEQTYLGSTGYPPAGKPPQSSFPPPEIPQTSYPPIGFSSVPEKLTPTESTGYPPAGETPQPPFTYPEISQTPIPPTGFPSITEEQAPPGSTGYPPAGKTPQSSFPPSEIPQTAYPPIGPPSVPEEQTPPESTGYPPAGKTPQSPFPPSEVPQTAYPPIGPPSFPEEQTPPESTGYPPAGETPQHPMSYPEIPQTPIPPIGFPSVTEEQTSPESTGYPPGGKTPEPSFPPPEISQTAYPPIAPPSVPEEQTSPESTGYPPSGEISQPPFMNHETPSDSRDIIPIMTIGPPPFRPPTPTPDTTPNEVTGYPPSGETPQQTFHPEDTPGAPVEPDTPQGNVQPTTSTFPPLVIYTSPPMTEVRGASQTETPILPENPAQPSLPEVNSSLPPPLVPKPGGTVPPSSEEDLKHPPHIHTIDVDCAKDMMTINIEFNRQFDGVIYSKGFYSNSDCRYVSENSRQTKYKFTVRLDSCGTQFVNSFDTANQSYLENVLVFQNEVGIQEVWDSIRSVRCLWEGSLSKSLTVSLSVGMLSEEIVTFSGDTAVARLDIQRGAGPFAPSANGLVPIGEPMTLVISVSGDPAFDIQVKDCKAKDTNGDLEYTLTDEDGCVLRPKLFGAFQKTKNPGNTDASIIAYAFFNAFKFPDLMDLLIECNVELCKTDCDVCPNPNQRIQPGKRRRRDIYNETIGEPVKVGKLLRVLLPEDLSDGETIIEVKEKEKICLSVTSFIVSSVLMISLLACSCFFSAYIFLKNRITHYKQYQ